MEQEVLQEFSEDFPSMIEFGFIAVKQLDEISATRIFAAAQALNPHSVAPQIGMGYIALNKLEVKEATRIFEQVCQTEPENYLAQTFLGISYLLNKTKQKKGEKIIREAIEKTKDPTIKNLGTLSLEWAEKDLKKIKSPFFSETVQEENSQTNKS